MTLGPLLVVLGVVITLFAGVFWYLYRSLAAYTRAFQTALIQSADQHAKFFKTIAGDEAVANRLDHFYARMEQQASATNEMRRDLDSLSDRLNSHLQRWYRYQRDDAAEAEQNAAENPQQALEKLINNPTNAGVPMIRQPRRW